MKQVIKHSVWGGAFLLLCIATLPTHAKTKQLYWVFLNSGAKRNEVVKTLSKEALEKMQSDHVGNLGRLAEKGILLAAGPLGGSGITRGIVVLTLDTPEQIKEAFIPDPFVQNGILEVQTFPLITAHNEIHKPDMPVRMVQHTLGVVVKGEHWTPLDETPDTDTLPDLLPTLQTLQRKHELALYGTLLGGGEQLGILLFRSENTAAIQAELSKDPAVREGRVRIDLRPQYQAAGVFRDTSRFAVALPKSRKRVSLFDSKTFAGWSGDTTKTWRIEAGAFVGGSLQTTVPHNDFLTTAQEYKNFDLRLKVKLAGKEGFLNGGIQIRSQRVINPPYEMSGYQADMGEGYWGSLYDESRRNKVLAQPPKEVLKRILKPNDWNDYAIRCEGNRIRLWLNGTLTIDYTEYDTSLPQKGLIGLQIHGGGKSQASYKAITIEELPD